MGVTDSSGIVVGCVGGASQADQLLLVVQGFFWRAETNGIPVSTLFGNFIPNLIGRAWLTLVRGRIVNWLVIWARN